MSLQQVLNYLTADAGNYTYNTSEIDFTATGAQLKSTTLTGQTFDQDFSSDDGFTYDKTLTEFVAGKLQSRDLQPAGTKWGASYRNSINLSFTTGGGSAAGTAVGGAAIASGRLDLKGDTLKYVSYDGNVNVEDADVRQTGTIKAHIYPNYADLPASRKTLFSICRASGDNRNLFELSHETDGYIRLIVKDLSGVDIINSNISLFLPTVGQEIEIKIAYDFTSGDTRVYIDQELKSTLTGTGTRDSNINQFFVGTDYSLTDTADFEFNDFGLEITPSYSTPSFIPSYRYGDNKYQEDLVTLPAFIDTYPLSGITAYTDFFVTQSNNFSMNIGGQYWDGAAWVASDDTLGQMNSAGVIKTNIASLTPISPLVIKLRTKTGSVEESIDSLSVEFTADGYFKTNPSIINNSGVLTDELEQIDFSDVDIPDGTNITIIIYLDGQPYYWDGAAWSISNETYAQSNILADVNDNIDTLFLNGGKVAKVKIFLNSDGTETPEMTQQIVNYSFFSPSQPVTTCVVYDRLIDPRGLGIAGATVKAFIDYPFHYNTNTVSASAEVITNSEGYWELELAETTSKAEEVAINITNPDPFLDVTYRKIVVPSQSTVSFKEIATAPEVA